MLTEPVVVLADAAASPDMQSHTEMDKDLGETKVWVYFPNDPAEQGHPHRDGYFARLQKMRDYFATPRDRKAILPAAK